MKPTALLALLLAGGCTFNPGNAVGDMGTGVGGDGSGDLAGGPGDMPPPGDQMICPPGAKSCSGATLSTCNGDGSGVNMTTCVLGCNPAGTDCQVLVPTAPAVSSDFSYDGLNELTITPAQTLLVFDTDTGEIRDNSASVVRMPNATPATRTVENGIGFHRVSGVGIWTFAKLSVPSTTTIAFKSAFAASILSASDLTIAGAIDARGYADPTMAATLCMGTVAGPGGTIGGLTASASAGQGGSVTDTAGGAGGGGYGATGGLGGKHGNSQGAAGQTVIDAKISPLTGGFGGGSSLGSGGGGGGALQLAAQGTLTISGGINAGGCGGGKGDATHGGGGGGSGGAILVEAPTVHLTPTAILAANGGGGGGGGDAAATAGSVGVLGANQAAGGSGGNNGFDGGKGGAANGSAPGLPGTDGNGAGGGGGGAGRVRLNSRTGATIDGGSVVSPLTSQGTVVIQ